MFDNGLSKIQSEDELNQERFIGKHADVKNFLFQNKKKIRYIIIIIVAVLVLLALKSYLYPNFRAYVEDINVMNEEVLSNMEYINEKLRLGQTPTTQELEEYNKKYDKYYKKLVSKKSADRFSEIRDQVKNKLDKVKELNDSFITKDGLTYSQYQSYVVEISNINLALKNEMVTYIEKHNIPYKIDQNGIIQFETED